MLNKAPPCALFARTRPQRTDSRKDSARGSHNGNRIVVEDSGDIFRGELVGGVTDKKARLADSTVTDHHTSVGASPLAGASQGRGLPTTHFIVATTMLDGLERAEVDVGEEGRGLLRRGVEMQGARWISGRHVDASWRLGRQRC